MNATFAFEVAVSLLIPVLVLTHPHFKIFFQPHRPSRKLFVAHVILLLSPVIMAVLHTVAGLVGWVGLYKETYFLLTFLFLSGLVCRSVYRGLQDKQLEEVRRRADQVLAERRQPRNS